MMSRGLKLGLFVVAFALIAGGLAWYFFGGTGTKLACNARIPAPKIVAFGDSLVAGNGATTEGGFVTLVSNKIGVPITNDGVSGDTTAQALARIDRALAQKPDIVLVLLGGNDALQKLREDQTEKNLDDIISRFQQGGAQVILLGVPSGIGTSDPYSSMFARLAKKYDVTYVSNILSGILLHPNLLSDAVHPNEKGYQMIADRVYPVLEGTCDSLPVSE